MLTSTEASLAAEAAQWKTEAAAAATQLSEARQRLVDIDAALLQRDEQVGPSCKLWWNCCSGRDTRAPVGSALLMADASALTHTTCPAMPPGCFEQVKQLQEQVEAAQGAAAQAAELTAEWRGRAEAFDRDRQAAASNIRCGWVAVPPIWCWDAWPGK